MASQIAIFGPILAALIAGQPDPRLKSAQAQAQQGVEATVRGDFGTIVDMTHGKVVAAMGGRQKTIEKISNARMKLEKDGTTYVSGKAEVPATLYKATSGLYCIIPVAYRVKSGEAKFLMKSPLIGFSNDGGTTWKFLDTSAGEATVRKIVPEIPKDLRFPPDEEPELDLGGE